MEFEFIKEEVKPITLRNGVWSTAIEQWLATENKTLKFKNKNAEEKRSCYQAVMVYRKKHNYDYTIYCEKASNNVYLVRA